MWSYDKKNEGGREGNDLLELRLKTDSFVVESDIHFPTDLWLLWDSIRKSLDMIGLINKEEYLPTWRKLKDWQKKLKKLYRAASNIHRKKGANYKVRLQTATKLYLEAIDKMVVRIAETLVKLERIGGIIVEALCVELKKYYKYVLKFRDQVDRRILKGEVIPQEEKIFSIFEEHVEWLSKGKIGKPVELGHKVLITTDQYHFIVDHKVLIKQSDKAVR